MEQLLGGLRDETNGNPFFALEILRYLASTGDVLQNASGRWEPRVGLDLAELPESVREVVAARVAAVGRDVTSTLATAALIGNEFGLGLLARVLDTDEDAVLEVLERAEPAGLVAFVGDDRFAFSHALIANSLAQDLGELRRATLHRRIAEELEIDDVDERNAGELARHWLAARGADAPDRALSYAELAGDRALAGLAPDDAVPWYRTALDLVGDDDAGAPRAAHGEPRRRAPTGRRRLTSRGAPRSRTDRGGARPRRRGRPRRARELPRLGEPRGHPRCRTRGAARSRRSTRSETVRLRRELGCSRCSPRSSRSATTWSGAVSCVTRRSRSCASSTTRVRSARCSRAASTRCGCPPPPRSATARRRRTSRSRRPSTTR